MKIFEMKVKKCKKLYRRRKKLLMSVDFDLSPFPILGRFYCTNQRRKPFNHCKINLPFKIIIL